MSNLQSRTLAPISTLTLLTPTKSCPTCNGDGEHVHPADAWMSDNDPGLRLVRCETCAGTCKVADPDYDTTMPFWRCSCAEAGVITEGEACSGCGIEVLAVAA